jgi:hypothetical protein
MLGALLGLANMTVIAIGIAVGIDEGFDAFIALMFLGSLPALLAGIALGSVAQRTREWSIGARYAVIGIPALAVVLLFGAVLLPFAYYVAWALLPTAIAVCIIERRTRAPSAIAQAVCWEAAGAIPTLDSLSRWDPISIGALLAFANLIVVAVGMSGMQHGLETATHHHGTALCGHPHAIESPGVTVFVIGLLPAMVTGVLLGRLAHACRAWPIWARRLVLTPLPLAVVVMLGAVTRIYDYVLLAFVPTTVAALVLERATRDRTLPIARAL